MYDGGGAWKLKQKGGCLSNEDNPFLKDESDLPIASRWWMTRFRFGDTQPTGLGSQPHSFVKTQVFPHVWPGGSQVLADVLMGPRSPFNTWTRSRRGLRGESLQEGGNALNTRGASVSQPCFLLSFLPTPTVFSCQAFFLPRFSLTFSSNTVWDLVRRTSDLLP